MPALKNIRHERFCQALFRGEPAVRAYESAGYKVHQGNSSRLRWFEMVQSRLAELQSEAAKVSGITVESLLSELEHARQRADSLNQLSASVKAISEKAKISGLLVQKIEVGKPGDFDNINSLPELLNKVRDDLGPDGAELLAAFIGVKVNSEGELMCVGSARYRQKLARYRAR